MTDPPRTVTDDDGVASLLWGLAAVAVVLGFGFVIVPASDLFWHLAAGRFMVDHHAVVRADPGWVYPAAGRTWVNDAWLSDVGFELWRRAFGEASLVWWKWGLLAAAGAWLFRALLRVSRHAPAACLVTVAAFQAAEPFLDLRPNLYSVAGMALVLATCAGASRLPWWLPAAFALWANLHPVALLGWGAAALLAMPHYLSEDRNERARSILVVLASGLALLANPRGIGIVERPVRYALTSSVYRTIAEWQPPFAPGGTHSSTYPYLIAAFATCAAAAAVLAISRPRAERLATFANLLAAGALLAVSLRGRRFVPLFALASGLAVAPVMARFVPRPRGIWARAIPAVLAAVCVIRLLGLPFRTEMFHVLTAEDSFPVESLNFASAAGLEGDLFAYYNWGGYVLDRGEGRLRVYIDGRADMVFDEATYVNYVRVVSGAPRWMDVIEDGGAGYVLWPKTKPEVPEALLATGRWELVFEDAVSVLLARADGPAVPSGIDTPDGPWRELRLGSIALDQRRLDDAAEAFRRSVDRARYLFAACDGLVQALDAGAARRAGDAARVERCHADFRLRDR